MSRRENGFTIVEITIVLAIAGLVLLVILLAVPLLVRNGHNNQRHQDVQTVLQAVSRWELNHSGTIPTTAELRTFLDTYEKKKLTFYEVNNISVSAPDATKIVGDIKLSADPAVADTNIAIHNHAKCKPNGDATNQGAGYSDVVALYAIETSNGITPKCQQL